MMSQADILGIRERIRRTPFIPFAIRTTDGRELLVPTAQHAWVPPSAKSLIVCDEDGTTNHLYRVHLAGVIDADSTDPGPIST